MANNIFPGNNMLFATSDDTFVAAGFSSSNCRVIYEVTPAGTKSWKPTRTINAVSKFTAGNGYQAVMKQEHDTGAAAVSGGTALTDLVGGLLFNA